MRHYDNAMKRQRPERRQRNGVSSNPLVGPRPTSTRFTSAVIVSSLLFAQTTAFSFQRKAFVPRSTALQSTRAISIQAVEPRRFTSMKERREAQNALDRQRGPPKDKLLDAQMLELLSDKFLYPTKPKSEPRDRPRGRPESVPGAMSYETMLRYREQIEEQELSTVIPYSASVAPAVTPAVDIDTNEEAVTKTRHTGVKGSFEDVVKKRKKVVKNLTEKKTLSEEEIAKQKIIRQRRGKTEKSVDLQKYYRTELLTAKEEYSLGMQVNFMMKCEEVHEGLATKLMRLPTMEEWAHACGFTDPDPTFVQMEGDEQIRPAGADDLFKELEPDMFVGNGLATEAGPGRGRGRVKKAPLISLGPYFDDSERKYPEGPLLPGESVKGRLVNTGTVTDFVDIMFTGREAKQRMVQSNMRLVVSIARKYANVGVNLQDLVQEGSLGLTRAAEKFEPQKGFKFSTYASWWIQQAVFRSIAYHSRTIRLPVHVHNLLNRIRKVRMMLERELGRTPTNDEMAEQLDMSTEKYNKMIRLTRRSISLELPKYQQNPKDLGHESDDLLGDTISGTPSVLDESDPEKRVDRGLFHEDLREMLQILDEDERRVICARYGLSDGLTRTVTTVAAQMKRSKAWVRSQECRALRKLRRPWYEQRLKEHQDALTS